MHKYSKIPVSNKIVHISNACHGDELRQKSMQLLCVGV